MGWQQGRGRLETEEGERGKGKKKVNAISSSKSDPMWYQLELAKRATHLALGQAASGSGFIELRQKGSD